MEVKDEDLLIYLKNVLQSRIMPINYLGLRDIVKQAPTHLKDFIETKYKADSFLNFLLSHPDIFNVNSDGTVTLVGSVEYIFPHGVDTVDSIAGISDDSYFGDREEYISDSDDDSHTSISSGDEHMLQKDQPTLSDKMQCSINKAFQSKLNDCHHEGDHNSTSSSESSQDYLSSASESGGSSSGDTNSSFESCNERDNNSRKSKNSNGSEKTSGSSSYSSCSES